MLVYFLLEARNLIECHNCVHLVQFIHMILAKQVHYKMIHHLCHGFHNSSKYTITNKVENGYETLSKNSPKNNLGPLE